MSNTFGTHFKLTTYGESHGPAIGGIVDGCPAGLVFDSDMLVAEMARRHIGPGATARIEADTVEILSGVYQGRTLGTPIAFMIRNEEAISSDYDELRNLYRPGHADYTYAMRYGIRDHRGGGRASGRETAARVVGGAIAKMLLREKGITVEAEVIKQGVAEEHDSAGGIIECVIKGLPAGIGNPVFGKLNAQLAAAMMSIPSAIGFEMGAGFNAATMKGSEFRDEWSGINENENENQNQNQNRRRGRLHTNENDNGELRTENCWLVTNSPPKLGGVPRRGEGVCPLENDEWNSEQKTLNVKRQTKLSTLNSLPKAANTYKSINGSEQLSTKTNHCGGIQGGISNGMPIVFRTAFHPVVTIDQPTECIDPNGNLHTWQPRGRHDRCHLPRTVVVVEAMAALTIADQIN